MNKGEWSELYTFLKLLGDGKLHAADEDLNQVNTDYYPIKNIFKQTTLSKDPIRFFVNNHDNGLRVVKLEVPCNDKDTFSSDIFLENAEILLTKILESKGSFEVLEIQDFLSSIGNPSTKAISGSKKDITLTAYDSNIQKDAKLGFSIKSRLGGAPTLFNAGKNTNFVYQVKGLENLPTESVAKAETLKGKKLLEFLIKKNCECVFNNTASHQFSRNLKACDSLLDVIFAEIVLSYYSGVNADLKSLTTAVEEKNPCAFDLSYEQPFYQMKVKQFLVSCALGLTAGAVWKGELEANGGYIIVKEDGSLVCYHIYNWNAFQDYLFNHTFLETASTTRHEFGTLYQEHGKYMLNLNLQIRFK